MAWTLRILVVQFLLCPLLATADIYVQQDQRVKRISNVPIDCIKTASEGHSYVDFPCVQGKEMEKAARENAKATQAYKQNTVAVADSAAESPNANEENAEASATSDGDGISGQLADHVMIEAGTRCPREIERLAKNAVQWTDGWLEPKFSRYKWIDPGSQIIAVYGDKAQFQNGFGAWVNVIYECDYDIQNKRVINAKITPGRF